MGYVVVFCIGGFVGFVISAFMTASSYSDKMKEIYDIGLFMTASSYSDKMKEIYDIGFEAGLQIKEKEK